MLVGGVPTDIGTPRTVCSLDNTTSVTGRATTDSLMHSERIELAKANQMTINEDNNWASIAVTWQEKEERRGSLPGRDLHGVRKIPCDKSRYVDPRLRHSMAVEGTGGGLQRFAREL